MSASDQEFLRKLRATFKVEAAEHLQTISAGLLGLESQPEASSRQQLIESVFRAAHSLKGAARAVDIHDIEALCQSLESLFASWKRGESQPVGAALDQAYATVDRMSRAITAVVAPTREEVAPGPVAPQTTPVLVPDTETVRVTVSSLDARLLEAEELLTAKAASAQHRIGLRDVMHQFEHWRREWNRIQPQVRTLLPASVRAGAAAPVLEPIAEFLEWNHGYLRSLETTITGLHRTAEQDQLAVSKLVDDLLENSKKLLMLPLASLGTLLPKLVRDLSRDQGKDAEFVVRGEDVTIDKRILEEMKDPLVHMLRNSVDHGVETPDVRRRAGKPQRATVTLAVSRVNGSLVEFTVSDDGAGIDVERVKAAAIKHGRIESRAAQQLTESEALALVFEDEVSTSPMITQVSGRGLGLAIVRERTEKLGGRVEVESKRGAGTTIRMTLPLTLATFRGILVESAARVFVIPTAHVERVTRVQQSEVQTIEGRDTALLSGRSVPLVSLAATLQLPAAGAQPQTASTLPAFIAGSGDQRIAFVVDAVLDEREILVKRLSKPLSRVRNIAGATVLSSGAVAPILNLSDLLESARSVGPLERAQPARAASVQVSKKILLAEDSITSRMLLKGILESAGYQVRTAVDGAEAFSALRSEPFDLLVSDVEMPRMNGFELAARVREERSLAELPVVLVTALESREDRERGIDAGANAYLVKSSLDQSNLLEALRRLL
ncbi:MAG TPA: response regulator [Steroidobacteraceae bacterium]|jgi:two-component system chemotaxis sensor kinase CheA